MQLLNTGTGENKRYWRMNYKKEVIIHACHCRSLTALVPIPYHLIRRVRWSLPCPLLVDSTTWQKQQHANIWRKCNQDTTSTFFYNQWILIESLKEASKRWQHVHAWYMLTSGIHKKIHYYSPFPSLQPQKCVSWQGGWCHVWLALFSLLSMEGNLILDNECHLSGQWHSTLSNTAIKSSLEHT